MVNALHATAKSESWQECTGRVYQELYNNKSSASIALFPKLLQKIPILLFAGDQDLICNHLGLEMLISALDWNGQIGFGVCQLVFFSSTLVIHLATCRMSRPKDGR